MDVKKINLKVINFNKSEGKLPEKKLLESKKSTIPNAGLGLFAAMDIDIDVDLGEYFGNITNDYPGGCYIWEYHDKNDNIKYVNGEHFKNNPLKYINGIKYKDQPTKDQLNKVNCMIKLINNKVHYVSTKFINKGDELFIDYGNQYWFLDECT
jgi:hypothetical protein